MITLEEYKEYLVNTYVHEIDNTKDKKIERKRYLENKYQDNYLNRIISSTTKIIYLIQEEKERNYYRIALDSEIYEQISLNLTGGWYSDIIYKDINGNLISDYILKKHFGNMLIVDTKIEIYEFDTEDPDILSYNYEYYLYIQGFLQNNKNNQRIKK